MKKKIYILMAICVLLLTVTGCGKQDNNNKQNNNSQNKINIETSESENYEVFTKMSINDLYDATWSDNSFFVLYYDGSEASELLKKEVEKLGHKYKWNIYLIDINELYEEKLKEKDVIAEIDLEKQTFIEKYCKYIEINESNINLYSEDEIETKDGKQVVFECSAKVAKEKDPEINIEENEIPMYSCNTCEKVKREILNSLNTEYGTDLVYYQEGDIAASLDGYLPDGYQSLNYSEKNSLIEESNDNLETWFKEIIEA
jgi:hypothetical protein